MTAIQIINRISNTYLFRSKWLRSDLRLWRSIQTAIDDKTLKVKKKKAKTHSKEIDKYLSSAEHLNKIKTEIPPRFLKKNRKAPDDLYLIDLKIAEKIVSVIKPHILDKNKTIIETNPGFGFLTEKLLKSGLQNAQIYESTLCFRNHILKIAEKYPNRLMLYNRDFFSIWRLSYQDRHDNGDRVKKMLSNIKIREWNSVPAMTIIGALASSNFIRHLMLSLIFQFGIMTYGRCELLVTIPPSLYKQLTSGPDSSLILYRSSSVLFQLFCDHEVLLIVPRKSFVPWVSTEISKTAKLKDLLMEDAESMYVTKIVFKKNLPVPLHQIKDLWYFTQHIMTSRKCRIIPTMEKWIPGCGIRLILNNIKHLRNSKFPQVDIYTRSGDLTPEHILEIYKQFSSWPEYYESAFIPSMESALSRMISLQITDEEIHVPEDTEELIEEES